MLICLYINYDDQQYYLLYIYNPNIESVFPSCPLLPFEAIFTKIAKSRKKGFPKLIGKPINTRLNIDYSIIVATLPEPTVLPPSRSNRKGLVTFWFLFYILSSTYYTKYSIFIFFLRRKCIKCVSVWFVWFFTWGYYRIGRRICK